jgi:uncharacterized tellurite resistance protein B-like protein
MSIAEATVWRYPGERVAMDQLLADEAIRHGLESGKAARERESLRTKLLGGAVMVEPSVLPHLAEAVDRIARQFPDLGALECFVYAAGDVNAFVTRGRTRTLVAVSSAAVNHLETAELEFVIGHELGHALFGHTEMTAGQLVEEGQLLPAAAMKLRAWQRAAEISADRAGLVLCGSIESAARALFKAASGVVSPATTVSPTRFAGQWQRLLDEVIDDGHRDFWQVTHPFPPLRMQAMLVFWNAWQAMPDQAPLGEANGTVEKMLAMMDPTSADGTLRDPMLGAFFFWGGLYVALADGHVHPEEVRRLESVVPAGLDQADAVARAQARPAVCLEAFGQALASRRRKLTAVELHRIVYGLIDVACADGKVSADELERLREVGGVLGVPAQACDLIIRQYEKEVGRAD